jgi:hypothetical protein
VPSLISHTAAPSPVSLFKTQTSTSHTLPVCLCPRALPARLAPWKMASEPRLALSRHCTAHSTHTRLSKRGPVFSTPYAPCRLPRDPKPPNRPAQDCTDPNMVVALGHQVLLPPYQSRSPSQP